MDKIYAGIDVGTDSVKIVVAQLVNEKYHVLAAVSKKSAGVKRGQIVDTKPAVKAVRDALVDVENILGFPLRKVIACIPTEGCQMKILSGSVDVIDTSEINGTDVTRVLKDALIGKITSEEELVTAMPINFTIDETENVQDPKGLSGETLATKIVVSTVPKEPLYRILEVLKLSGLEVVDIAFTSTGDYYEVKTKKLDLNVGAIINIGKTSTTVSIYNKGIMIKNSLIGIGSKNIDKDIAYVFKIDNEKACYLKESFAIAKSSYADINDIIELEIDDGKKSFNQKEISNVVESRVLEILKLAKKEINNLTNREIRYIIITGGISEISEFQNIVQDVFGRIGIVCNITTMGIRHNKFSSVFGLIKYYEEKLRLRGKKYSMIEYSDVDKLHTNEIKEINNENIINKVFGHFFDN